MGDNNSYFEEIFPGEGVYARCERGLHKFISIDKNSSLTRNHFKSLTVIKAETLRHLLLHRNVIHCFSRFRYFWEFLMMITYGMAFILVPYDVAFIFGTSRQESYFIKTVISIINIVCLIDTTIEFRSSYQDHRTKEIVLEGRKIASHHIRFYFWVDLLSVYPDDILSSLVNKEARNLINNYIRSFQNCVEESLENPNLGSSSEDWEFHCSLDGLAMLSLLKLLYMPLFFKYLVNFLKCSDRSNYYIKTVKNLLTLIFCFHFLVCLKLLSRRIFFSTFIEKDQIILPESSVFIENQTSISNLERYIDSFYYTTFTVSLFANEMLERTQAEMAVGIFFTLIGIILNILLISEAYMYFKTAYGPYIRFQEIRYQIRMYIRFKRLSKTVQQRILAFYDFSFRGKFFRKREINELIGSLLKNMMIIDTCKEMLRENYLFKQLPDEILNSIAYCMSEVLFLRNDVICKVDSTRPQKLFLILSGTVAVYTETGEEVVHLHDGNMFGETNFVLYDENYQSWNYVATEETVLLVLTRNDFMKVLAETPELLIEMRNCLKKRSTTG